MVTKISFIFFLSTLLWHYGLSKNLHLENALNRTARQNYIENIPNQNGKFRSGKGSRRVPRNPSCYCPYQSCGELNDQLLYAAVGVALGFLLGNPMMMMSTMGNAGDGTTSRGTSDEAYGNLLQNFLMNEDLTLGLLALLNTFKHTISHPECSKKFVCEANMSPHGKKNSQTVLGLLGCIAGLVQTMDNMAFTETVLPVIFNQPKKNCDAPKCIVSLSDAFNSQSRYS